MPPMQRPGPNDDQPPPEAIPRLPWDMQLNSALAHVEKQPDGRVLVAFTPAVQQPGGFVFAPPQVRVFFSPEGFERFQADIVAAGSRVEIARVLPPHMT